MSTTTVLLLNSNLIASVFSAIATFAAGYVVYLVYAKAREDEMSKAAKILVMEIRDSERIIQEYRNYKDNKMMYPDTLVNIMPNKAWIKYSHLFVEFLSADEYDYISAYYRYCYKLEEATGKYHNFFWITTEERAKQQEAIGARLTSEAFEKPENANIALGDFTETLKRKIDAVTGIYHSNTTGYKPDGINMEIATVLDSVRLISNTPVWNKLKKVARYNEVLS